MARLLKNILSLALFFIGFYIVLLFVISLSTAFTFKVENLIYQNPGIYTHDYRRIQDFHNWVEARPDAKRTLILGSSTANMNLDPDILQNVFSTDIFNCGTDAQTIALSEKILKYAVARTNVDYLLLDVHPGMWNHFSHEPVIIWTTNNLELYNGFMFDMVASERSVKVWNYYCYFMVKRLLPFAQYQEKAPLPTRIYKGRGHVCIDDTVRTSPAYSTDYREMSADNTQALHNIAEICRERNIQLIISIPKVLNADIDESLVRVEGVPLISAAEFAIDSTYFKDSHHMFCKGAEKYSHWLSGRVKGLIKQE